jgi:hypothetical protein
MSRTRFRVVFLLLVLILLAASILSGLLTYGLGMDEPPASTPGGGGKAPNELPLQGTPGYEGACERGLAEII